MSELEQVEQFAKTHKGIVIGVAVVGVGGLAYLFLKSKSSAPAAQSPSQYLNPNVLASTGVGGEVVTLSGGPSGGVAVPAPTPNGPTQIVTQAPAAQSQPVGFGSGVIGMPIVNRPLVSPFTRPESTQQFLAAVHQDVQNGSTTLPTLSTFFARNIALKNAGYDYYGNGGLITTGKGMAPSNFG